MGIEIRPLKENDLENVRLFTDKWIGENYFLSGITTDFHVEPKRRTDGKFPGR